MRLIHRRAAARRGFACLLAIALVLVPVISGVRAQEMPAGGSAVITSAGQPVLLREQPGYDAAVLVTLGDGNPLDVAGEPVTASDGTSWLPVIAGGQSGYVPAGYVSASPMVEPAVAPEPVPETATAPPVSADPVAAPAVAAPSPGTTGATTTEANLRAGPGVDTGILTVLPPGTTLSIDGPAENGFVPVTGNGASGWVAAELLGQEASVVAPPPAAPAANASATATAMSDLMLLPAPDQSSGVITVIPAGSALLTTGAAENGYVPVDYGDQAGWVEGTSLSIAGSEATSVAPGSVDTAAPVPAAAPPSSAPVPAPEATRGESTGITWPFAGGEWEVVQGYNTGTHTNRSGFAQYKYSLDWARVDGDTAGQPVFAPVSGTVQWVDRGSGGMLVDAGNGYGVAIFHVTLDRDLARGATVEQGQRIGTISGPGGEGYMSMAHIDITVWSLAGRGHEAVPFVGPNAIAGREFPDTGGANQHMGATVTP